jgi:hypothetical protein
MHPCKSSAVWAQQDSGEAATSPVPVAIGKSTASPLGPDNNPQASISSLLAREASPPPLPPPAGNAASSRVASSAAAWPVPGKSPARAEISMPGGTTQGEGAQAAEPNQGSTVLWLGEEVGFADRLAAVSAPLPEATATATEVDPLLTGPETIGVPACMDEGTGEQDSAKMETAFLFKGAAPLLQGTFF